MKVTKAKAGASVPASGGYKKATKAKKMNMGGYMASEPKKMAKGGMMGATKKK
jgi:hypothetical protein